MNAKDQITEIAQLMEEFRLDEANFEQDGLKVSFKRNRPSTKTVATSQSLSEPERLDEQYDEVPETAGLPAAPAGIPVTSPMSGIFYSTPSPGQPPYIKEGATVNAGQVIGVIESMKVFNEIPSPMSGVIKKIVAENGALVNPGDVLVLLN